VAYLELRSYQGTWWALRVHLLEGGSGGHAPLLVDENAVDFMHEGKILYTFLQKF
jgi:hypothetical protein